MIPARPSPIDGAANRRPEMADQGRLRDRSQDQLPALLWGVAFAISGPRTPGRPRTVMLPYHSTCSTPPPCWAVWRPPDCYSLHGAVFIAENLQADPATIPTDSAVWLSLPVAGLVARALDFGRNWHTAKAGRGWCWQLRGAQAAATVLVWRRVSDGWAFMCCGDKS